jgi:hypothetical protein
VSDNEHITRHSLPFLVKAVAVFLLVYGAVNGFYYLAVFVYSLINPDFLKDLTFGDFKGNWLLMPVIFKMIFGWSFVLSGLFIFLRKPYAKTIYYFAFFISFFFSLFFLSYFNYVDFGAGVVGVLILYFHKGD